MVKGHGRDSRYTYGYPRDANAPGAPAPVSDSLIGSRGGAAS
jgi:hypothetical protein